jgi:hypothetical protein
MAPAVPLLLNLSGISGYRKTMTLPEISAAITSARTIAKVFKGLMGLGIDSQLKDVIIDAQNVILDLQGQIFDIRDKFEEQADEVRELREKLREKEDWNVTAANYELAAAGLPRPVMALLE